MEEEWSYRLDIIDGPTRCGQLEKGDARVHLPFLLDLSRGEVLHPSPGNAKVELRFTRNGDGENDLSGKVKQRLDRIDAGGLSPGVGAMENELFLEVDGSRGRIPLISERLSSMLLDDPRELSRIIMSLREKAPAHPPIFIPGAGGSPEMEVLLYLGVEVFDTSRALLDAASGTYYLQNGELNTRELERIGGPSVLCSCSICRTGAEMDPGRLSEHNIGMLRRRLSLAYLKLKEGRLREHVMGLLSGHPEWVSAVRFVEGGTAWDVLPWSRSFRKVGKAAVTYRDDLSNPDFRLFRHRVRTNFTPLEHRKLLLLLPCSARKPYSLSRTHRTIASGLHRLKSWKSVCQRLVVTSPLGAVPMELETSYPAAHYDIPVTGDWFHDEVTMTRDIVSAVLSRGDFDTVVCFHGEGDRFFPEEGESGSMMGSSFINVHIEAERKGAKPLDELRHILEREMDGKETVSPRDNDILEKLKLIEFSLGIRLENREKLKIKRAPSGDLLLGNGRKLADLKIGGPVPTLELANMVWNDGEQGRRVIIEDFIPRGTIFNQGIISVSGDIVPGDVVLVGTEDAPKAVGRALVPGSLMRTDLRGGAVRVIAHVR